MPNFPFIGNIVNRETSLKKKKKKRCYEETNQTSPESKTFYKTAGDSLQQVNA